MAPHVFWSTLLLGLFTFAVLPGPYLSVPLLMGLTAGAYLATGRALVVALSAWCLVLGLSQLPLAWFPLDYNEVVYQSDVAARTHGEPLLWLAGVAVTAVSALVASRASAWTASRRRKTSWTVVALLVAGFWWRVNQVSPDFLTAVDREPEPGAYHFDGQITIKALYLASRGADYFHAFWDAAQSDSRFLGNLEGQSLRNPALFSFWRLLPTVSAVVVTAWLLVSCTMVVAYRALDRWGGQPLLSCWVPAGIAAASLYPFSNYWLFINDPWAGNLMAITAALLLMPRASVLASIFAALTFWCRELCGLMPLCLLALHAAQRRWRALAISVLGLVVAAVLYQYTRSMCAQVLHFSSLGLSYRIKLSPVFALRCLHFGQQFVPARDLVLPLLLPLHVYGLLRFGKSRPELGTLLLHNLLLWSAFVCLGGGAAYYGWNWTPAALVAGGAVLASSFPRTERAGRLQPKEKEPPGPSPSGSSSRKSSD